MSTGSDRLRRTPHECKAAHQHVDGHAHAILRWSDDSAHDIDETARYPLMAEAIRQILVEKGLISADTVRRLIEQMDARSDVTGCTIVARAWVDPAFKERLLANAKEAIAELGIPAVDATHLIVVENTETVHNVVVCTVCSCYPRTVLGMPPEWYKSKAYRSRVVRKPRAVLKEFGTDLADTVTVRVHDSNADMRYLVLPMRPRALRVGRKTPSPISSPATVWWA